MDATSKLEFLPYEKLPCCCVTDAISLRRMYVDFSPVARPQAQNLSSPGQDNIISRADSLRPKSNDCHPSMLSSSNTSPRHGTSIHTDHTMDETRYLRPGRRDVERYSQRQNPNF